MVGIASDETHPNNFSSVNEITSYSRRDPGFNGFFKQNLTAYRGSILYMGESVSVHKYKYSLLLDRNGDLTPDSGTSFTAPIVAKDFAELLGITPNQDILMAKALL